MGIEIVDRGHARLGEQRSAQLVGRCRIGVDDQDSLCSESVKFRVENPLPRSEIEAPFRDGGGERVVREVRLEVSIPVVLACLMVKVIFPVRSQALNPFGERKKSVPPNNRVTIRAISVGRYSRLENGEMEARDGSTIFDSVLAVRLVSIP